VTLTLTLAVLLRTLLAKRLPSMAARSDKVTDDLDSNLLLEGERSGGGNVIPLILVFEINIPTLRRPLSM
jgi:hypothetical protein